MLAKTLLRFTALLLVTIIPTFAQAPAADADAEAKAFKDTVNRLDVNGNFLFYANATDVIEVMDKVLAGARSNLVPLFTDGNPNRKQAINATQNLLDNLYKTSGVREIRGIGISNRTIGDGVYRTKAFLPIDPARKGKMWTLLGGKPKPMDYVSMLPKTTVGASVTNFDLPEMWKYHFELVQATGDAQMTGIHGMVMAGLKNKIDLEKLFGSTAGTFGILVTLDTANEVSIPTRGEGKITLPEPGIAFFAKVKDSSMKDYFLSKMTRRKEGKRVPLPYTEKTVKGVVIRSFAVPFPTSLPTSPSIATIGDYLVVANTTTVVEAMINAQTSNAGLASKPGFKALMKDLPTSGTAFAYGDPLFAKTVLSVQKQMADQGKADRKRAMDALMKVYPMAQETFAISVVSLESNGISVIGKSNVSAPKAFAEEIVRLASWTGGIFLPRITKGAGEAKVTKCQGNLKQIGLGLLMHAGDNKGAFPDDLGVLYDKNYLQQGSAYVCPATADTLPRSGADVRAGNCSFVYLGKGLRDDDPNGANLIIAHDKPTNHGTSINFLFVDGSVKMVTTADPARTAKERGWVLPAVK